MGLVNPPPFPSPTVKWFNDTYDSISPSRPELSAKGKRVIVTGAGTGIGEATAKAFAQAGAASVAITGRRLEPLEATKANIAEEFPSTKVTIHQSDVTDQEAWKRIATEIGTWDVAVLNAGFLPEKALIAEANLSDWWNGFEINIKGIVVPVQALLATRAKNAVLIGTASGAVAVPISLIGPSSGYVAPKLAVIKLLEYIQYENPDLRVVSFHPGVVETDMYRKGNSNIKDVDTVELPAHATVWLASPEAEFLKGKFFFCNWDVEELKQAKEKIQNSDLFTTTIAGWPFDASTLVA